MSSEYQQRQAEFAKKAAEKEAADRQKEVIIGTIIGKAEKNISAGKELKIKMNDVEQLSFTLSSDMAKGDSLKIIIQADPSLSAQKGLSYGREKQVRADEASGKVTGTIKKDRDTKIKIDDIETQKFQPSSELDRGDSIRILFERM